jgi:uncharacterized protein
MTKKDYLLLQNMIEKKLNTDLKVEYIHGYLTAVLCAPFMIAPSEWLTLIMEKNGNASFLESPEDAGNIINPIMTMYNEIADSLLIKTFKPLLSIKDEKITTDTAETWSRGFVLGLNLWRDSFISDDKSRGIIMPILMLAKSEMVMDTINKETNTEMDKNIFQSLMQEALDSLSGNVIELRYHNQPGLSNSNKEFNNDTFEVHSGKTGRNDPCPCGSGKKYKKCCG